MLNESHLLLSLDALKTAVVHDLSILDAALTYVLVYVTYRALGRYIYFKPEEHASKLNRTFLALSLLVISIHFLDATMSHLPFLPEYRWLYAASVLTLLLAPLSILMHRIVWQYHPGGYPEGRNWIYRYMPIPLDYYKTTIHKSEQNGSISHSWEEEGVESTRRNLHSDALLNMLALVVYISIGVKWAHVSAGNYGNYSLVFAGIVMLWITAIYLDRSVFSWITYLEHKRNR